MRRIRRLRKQCLTIDLTGGSVAVNDGLVTGKVFAWHGAKVFRQYAEVGDKTEQNKKRRQNSRQTCSTLGTWPGGKEVQMAGWSSRTIHIGPSNKVRTAMVRRGKKEGVVGRRETSRPEMEDEERAPTSYGKGIAKGQATGKRRKLIVLWGGD